LSRDPSAPKHTANLLQTLLDGSHDDDQLVSLLIENTGVDLKGFSIPEFIAFARRQFAASDAAVTAPAPARRPVQAALPMETPKQPPRTGKKTKSPEERVQGVWISPHETVDLAGLTLPGGLFYVGQKLKTGRFTTEPSLINPQLAVADTPEGCLPHLFGGWEYYRHAPLHYAQLSPGNRRRYLEWLAGGRCDPAADLRLVILFFCGLERRVIQDMATATADFPAIRAELLRLRDIYGHNRYFCWLVGNLLALLDCATRREKLYETPPDLDYASTGLTPGIRMALGQLIKDRKPLSPEWALAWALGDDRISRPKPVWNCPKPFRLLFLHHFSREHPRGIPLPGSKTQIGFYYRPFSAELKNPWCQPDLPDVIRLTAPLKLLQLLVTRCVEQLQSYSRAASREPDKAMAMETLLLLPPVAWPEELPAMLMACIAEWGDRVALLSSPDMLDMLGCTGDKLSPGQWRALATGLRHNGMGMEPDILNGAKTPAPHELVSLFRESAEAAASLDSPAFLAAATTLDAIARVVVTAEADPALVLPWLTARIDTWVHLHPEHRLRLRGRFRPQCRRPATLTHLKPRLEALPAAARRPVAQLLAQAACQKDMPSAATVKLLEKCYQHLDVDRALLYSDLHAPAPVGNHRPAITSGAALTLDPERIARLQQETAQVSALLADVFVEDEPEMVTTTCPDSPADTATAPETNTATLWGLDADHSALLRRLLTRPSWPRAEVQALAAALGLMTDGALEHLNEAAFDHADGPLTEGDDPLEINPDILENPPA
jgi:hypothetical protein